ncbi:MAG TPA: hypothetical protein VG826_11700 [Pirellulales bacterium]|nr:hypothetical protein [Pirellulales bacterium]
MAKKFRFHEFADLFPLLEGVEFEKLVADIHENGLREDIVVHDSKILDGRNRYRACRAAGVEPRYRTYNGDTSPWGLLRFVVSANLRRRHLAKDVLAVCAAEAEDLISRLATAAKEKQRQAGGDKRSAARRKPLEEKIPQAIDGHERAPQVRTQLAEIFGTNERYVGDAIRLRKEQPDVVEEIKRGTKRLSRVKADEKKKARIAELREHSNLVSQKAPPKVLEKLKYACILVDASWYSGENDTNWIDVTGGMPIEDYAANDAMIFVRTGGSRIAAGRAESLIGRWGFLLIDEHLLLKGVVDRRGRFFRQTVEEVVVGVRGKPQWPGQKPDGLVQCPPGKVHRLIETLTPFADNLRLELFSQRPRKGWVCWADGKEPVAA